MSTSRESSPADDSELIPTCKVCLFECDPIKSPAPFVDSKQKAVDKTLADFRDLLKCTKCELTVHKICVRAQGLTEAQLKPATFECVPCRAAKKGSAPHCLICRSNDGEVTTHRHKNTVFSGHFVCLYLSCRFILCDGAFLPVTDEAAEERRLSLDAPLCQKCSETVDPQDTHLRCGCEKVCHLFCVLYERIQAIEENRYADAPDNRFPSIRLDRFTRQPVKSALGPATAERLFEVFEPILDSLKTDPQAFLRFLRRGEKGAQIETAWLEFQMICEECYNLSKTSLFCCKTPRDLPSPDFAQCSICTLWVHTDDKSCARLRESDDLMLSRHMNVTPMQRPKKRGFKQASKVDDITSRFFTCPNCFGLGAHLICCDGEVEGFEQSLRSHDHPVASLIVREEALGRQAKGYAPFQVFRKEFADKYHLNLAHFDVLDRFLESKVDGQEADTELGRIQEQLTDLLTKETITTADIEQGVELSESLKTLASQNRHFPESFLLTAESVPGLTEAFHLMHNFLTGEKISLVKLEKQIRRISEERLAATDPQLSTLLTRFTSLHVSNPVAEFQREVVRIKADLMRRRWPESNLTSPKGPPSTAVMTKYLASLPSVAQLDQVAAQFESMPFARCFIQRFRGKSSLEFLHNFREFTQFEQFMKALGQLMDIEFMDPARLAQAEAFYSRLEIFTQFKNRANFWLERTQELQRIESPRRFLDDFEENMKLLVPLGELEAILREGAAVQFREPQLTECVALSRTKDAEFQHWIEEWQLSTADGDFKSRVQDILSEVVHRGVALTPSVVDFLGLYRHRVACESLIYLKKPITLEEFAHIYGGIIERYVQAPYWFRQLTKNKEDREALAASVKKQFEVQLSVSNFREHQAAIEKLMAQASVLKQRHPELDALEQNLHFWGELDKVLIDEMSDTYDISPENQALFMRCIETCTLPQVEAIYQPSEPKFVIQDLEILFKRVQMRYWDLKLQSIFCSTEKTRLSFVHQVAGSNKNQSDNLAILYQKMCSEKVNSFVELVGRTVRNEQAAKQLCQRIASDEDVLGNIKEYSNQIWALLGEMAVFEVDVPAVRHNLTCLTVIGIVFRVISEAKLFVEVCRRKSADAQAQAEAMEEISGSKTHSRKEAILERSLSVQRRQSTEPEYNFEANFNRLKRIKQLFRDRQIGLPSNESDMEKLSSDFLEFMNKLSNNRKKIDEIYRILIEFRRLDDSRQGSTSRIQESEFLAKLESVSVHSWLFEARIQELREFYNEFDLAMKRVLDLVKEICFFQVSKVLQGGRLQTLDNFVRALELFPIDSSKKVRVVGVARAIQGVYNASEKSAKILKEAIECYFDKAALLSEEQLNWNFGNDLEVFKLRLEAIDDELTGLKTKVVLDSDFRRSIELVQAFLRDSPIQSSFSYLVYSDLRAEIEAIAAFLDGNPKAYIAFALQSKTEIQLTEAMQLQLAGYKKMATKYNQYAEKHLKGLAPAQEYNLYRVLKEPEAQLCGYHVPELHSFFERVRQKREAFEAANALVEEAFLRGEPIKDISVLFLPNVITADFLDAPKKRLYVTSLEAAQLLLKRAFLLVENWQPEKATEAGLSELVSEMRLEALTNKLERKDEKKGKKIYQVISDTCKAFVHCLLRMVRRKWEAKHHIWPSGYLQPFLSRLNLSYEAQKDNIRREFTKTLREAVPGGAPGVAVPDEESVQGLQVLTRFLLKDLCNNIQMWSQESVRKFQKEITDHGQEQSQGNTMARQIFEEIMRTDFITNKSADARKKISQMAEKLSAWVEEGKGSRGRTEAGPGLGRRKGELNDSGLGGRSLVSAAEASLELSVDRGRGGQVNRYEEVRKFISKLNQKPETCKELVRNDFSFDCIIRLIFNKSDDYKTPAKPPALIHNESSRHSQKSLLNLSYSHIPVETRPEPPIDVDEATDSRKSQKKVKAAPEPPVFMSPQVSLRTQVWELTAISINFQDTLIDLALGTSLNPELYPYLAKSVIFIKNKTLDFVKKAQTDEKLMNLRHHYASDGVIGSIALKEMLESTLERVRASELCYTSMFGGWFVWGQADSGRSPAHAAFGDLLSFTKQRHCFLEEVFSMSGLSIKVYIGSARLISLRMAGWLRVLVAEGVSADDLYVLVCHRPTEDKQVTENKSIRDFVRVRVGSLGAESNQLAGRVEGVQGCDPLWQEVVGGLRGHLERN
jgi:hypothetical protein